VKHRLALAAVLLVATGILAGCGGAEETQAPAKDTAAPAAASAATGGGPTQAQIAFREELLAQIRAGDYECHCTSALRAKERVASGKAKAPPADQLLSNQPPP
jgi:hypothetical protein